VICYRLSHYLVSTRLSFICRLLHVITFFYSRIEIDPYATIGPGLVLGDIGGIGIPGKSIIGKNCTFLGFNTLTLNKISGVDFHVAQIVLGDHCVLGVRAKIMRPITIADGAQIKDSSLVMFSVANVGTTLSGIPAKKRRIDSYEDIIKWNPLMGGLISKGR
jgi:serine acetyltransferase